MVQRPEETSETPKVQKLHKVQWGLIVLLD